MQQTTHPSSNFTKIYATKKVLVNRILKQISDLHLYTNTRALHFQHSKNSLIETLIESHFQAYKISTFEIWGNKYVKTEHFKSVQTNAERVHI